MKPYLISAIRIASVLLGILAVIGVGMTVLNVRTQSASIAKLDSFGKSVPLGTLRTELANRSKNVPEFQFMDFGESAVVRFHTCHCRFHFEQDRIISISRTVCND